MSKYEYCPDFESQKTKKKITIKRITKKRKEKNKKRKTNNEKRKTNQLHLALFEVFMRSVGTVNVLKV